MVIREQIGEGMFKTVFKGTVHLPAAVAPAPVTAAILRFKQQVPKEEVDWALLERVGKHLYLVSTIAYATVAAGSSVQIATQLCPAGDLHTRLQDLADEEAQVSPLVALRIALQAAMGLQQLASVDVIHRDVAARNILLQSFDPRDQNKVHVKVGDYGLSKAGGAYYYDSRHAKPLPVRWMSPEANRRHRFSEKSDVWAYAVMLWEVFSLGDKPYFLFPDDSVVIGKIVAGVTLEQPALCPAAVFAELLQPCWAARAQDRPSFTDLVATAMRLYDTTLLEGAQGAQGVGRAQGLRCVVCLDAAADTAFSPCGHKCVCQEHSSAFASGTPCPLCRAPIQSALKIYE